MSIVDRAKALRAQIESMVISLEDEAALKAKEFFPSWESDTQYTIGDRVRYNNILYKCLTAHTAQADWNPKDAVSLWTRVLMPDPEVVPEWVQPESTNPYMKGDKVKHIGKTWVSTVDNNVWEPSVYGWDEVI